MMAMKSFARLAALVAAALLGAVLFATPANANATAPTNGGNGAGQSGQCTGPADERPASCQSP